MVIDQVISEFQGSKKIGGSYDVINGVQTNCLRFYDPRLRLSLVLDCFSTNF